MSYNKPLEINFSDEEIAEIKQAISDMTLEMMESGIVVTFLNAEQDTPICPCSVHTIGSLPQRSHLQYRIGIDRSIGVDMLVPAMVVVKIDAKREEAYPWPVRVIYSLLHEYSHVKTVNNVNRVDGKLKIDQEDCEYQCFKYMRDYLLQRFDSKLAEKIWLVTKVIICMLPDSHYNKSFMYVMDLHDFKE